MIMPKMNGKETYLKLRDIAHDFNNILAIIMGYCHLTKMDYAKAESKPYGPDQLREVLKSVLESHR
jgi:hypothetical protein